MKGMALQVRERDGDSVCMLPSLVDHAIEYKMIVGTHKIVDVRHMWEVPSSSSGMADVGAYHTIG